MSTNLPRPPASSGESHTGADTTASRLHAERTDGEFHLPESLIQRTLEALPRNTHAASSDRPSLPHAAPPRSRRLPRVVHIGAGLAAAAALVIGAVTWRASLTSDSTPASVALSRALRALPRSSSDFANAVRLPVEHVVPDQVRKVHQTLSGL